MKLPRQIQAVLFVILLTGAIAGVGLVNGCVGTTPVTVAAKTEGVVIPTVNAAMFSWRDWVVAGHATQAQVDQVKKSYDSYYSAQLVASNSFVAYFANTGNTTNTANVALDAVLKTATDSQTNLLFLLKSFQGK